ncbi:MAG: radical SAM family heme chaperone HemW [Bacteroidales bacterium]|nr:radical SAM family heme chaperone HemW [Bacteroidales bacterium]
MRKKCHYCDFHRSVNTEMKEEMIKAMVIEMDLKRSFLSGEIVDTIYFGGGTPSILSSNEINHLINKVYELFSVSDSPEITLEANPDDITKDYIKNVKNYTKVNRLSIGIQSFNNDDLSLMNRRHDSKKAKEAIELSLSGGFDNLSIDLIYGLPGMNVLDWKKNLEIAFQFPIKHLSAYHLTYEPDTVFYKKLQKGILKKPLENESITQFDLLHKIVEKHHFIPYEISNFAQEGFFSRHNTNYWMQKKYLGLGPSAHSYNLISRHWNVADNQKYIRSVFERNKFFTSEELDCRTRFNEFIITRLRTIWGINLKTILNEFGTVYFNHILQSTEAFISQNKMTLKDDFLFLTREGLLISDFIFSELMIDEDVK